MNPFANKSYCDMLISRATDKAAYDRAKEQRKRKRKIEIEARQKATTLAMLKIELGDPMAIVSAVPSKVADAA